MKKQLIVSVAALGLLAGCGYSEDEWQAQLAKYEKLNAAYGAEKAEHAKARQELEELQARIGELTKQLEDMGFKLQETGTEKQKLGARLEELNKALDEYKARAAALERIKARFEELRSKLNKLTDMGLKVSIRNNRMVISLPGDVLFASGQDKLKPEGVRVLGQVAEVIRNDPSLRARYFQVAGHTDSKPLKGGPFKDNWGLSAMRAREVLVYLTAPADDKDGGGGLDPARLHAAGYGSTDPAVTGTDDASLQANRRVELVLMPDVEEMLDLRSFTQ